MTEETYTFHYHRCALNRLSDPLLASLVRAAREATYTAYAPYSHFYVGAAVLLSDGSIVTGNNQENAAFGAGTCAERTALVKAVSEGHRDEAYRQSRSAGCDCPR